MNEHAPIYIDFLTGMSTTITGAEFPPANRDECAALNRLRAGCIVQATHFDASGKPVSPSGWSALVARRAAELKVPLIPLGHLGLTHSDEGFLVSRDLNKLQSGAEAQPYLDDASEVVYKLFDLTPAGSLGMKLHFTPSGEGMEMNKLAARLTDTLEKICLLHEMGAHPTEIVGLAETGDFLIVKQPKARRRPYSQGLTTDEYRRWFEDERHEAIGQIKGVECISRGLREKVVISAVDGNPWGIADLHERNIMLDATGRPTIIDALIGPVPSEALRVPAVAESIHRALVWRRTGALPDKDRFDAGDDAEL